MKLLVTDLDNTLYDWVTFFSRAFGDMLAELERVTGVERDTLVAEFKAVHRQFGESERPFAVLELPSVQRVFGTTSREDLRRSVDSALHAFNRSRKEHLKLYPSVRGTLERLTRSGVRVVAHTEATAVNAYWRLKKLDISQYFSRLYALEGKGYRVDQLTVGAPQAPPGFVRLLSEQDRKPNPQLLRDICTQEGVRPTGAAYVGDSLVKDISMAKGAGVLAIWAKYGTVYDASLWSLLVSVTHWTDDDVLRERELKRSFSSVVPDAVIEQFSDIEAVFLGQDE